MEQRGFWPTSARLAQPDLPRAVGAMLHAGGNCIPVIPAGRVAASSLAVHVFEVTVALDGLGRRFL